MESPWSFPSPAPTIPASASPAAARLGGGVGIQRAVIVGGGLGGLAAAIQLRSIGIDAQIYEKSHRISGGEGTLISLFPNGCRALNEAVPEVVEKMRDAGLANIDTSIVTKDGAKIGEWSLSTQMEEKFGQPMIAILWRDALRILAEALPKECIHTGFECFNVTEDENGAITHFKSGNETILIQAPLVVGADGIHSVVRTSLFDYISPRDNGRTMWRAVINSNCCSHKALRRGVLASQKDGHTMLIVNGVHGTLYWAVSVEDMCCNGTTQIRSRDQHEAKERVLEYFKGWDIVIPIIQATEPHLILERRVIDMPVLPNWSKGHCVLLGDAVHAVTPALGQGANLAFEDGLELALSIASSSELRSAFESYEKSRIPRARKVSEKSQDGNALTSDEFYNWLYMYDPLTRNLQQ